MMRRELLKASVSALATVPGLPNARAGSLHPLGTKPVHSAADFRKAFDEYLTAYRAFYPMPDGPDRDAPYEAHCVYEGEMNTLCAAWADARRRLLEMVLNNHGSTFEEWGSNVAGVAVDIGDLVFVAAPDPDEEGTPPSHSHLVIVPRSPEMTALLDGLYFSPPIEPAPQVAATADASSSRPLAVDITIRQALESYIAAYTTFFSKEYEEPEFETDEENNAYWTERADSCAEWKEARRALTRMVLEANGFDPDGDAPNTVSAALFDFTDLLIVVGGDPDYEGSLGCRTGLYLAGKTPAMRARLAALPVWEDSGGGNDSLLVGWNRSFLKPRPDRDYLENDVCVVADR
jgi:hypothetical protein